MGTKKKTPPRTPSPANPVPEKTVENDRADFGDLTEGGEGGGTSGLGNKERRRKSGG